MQRDEYDTTQPFLAICALDAVNGVYFINPTGEVLGNITATTGGLLHTGEEATPAQPGAVALGTCSPASVVLVETTGDREFAAFACWWTFEFDESGVRHTLRFAARRYLSDALACERLPVLERPGLVVRRR